MKAVSLYFDQVAFQETSIHLAFPNIASPRRTPISRILEALVTYYENKGT